MILNSLFVCRFAERHKYLINAYLRHRPHLLEGNMAALLKQPRLIDFDAKKQYFKSVISNSRERRAAPLKLALRRDHVFEDSFRQMHIR